MSLHLYEKLLIGIFFFLTAVTVFVKITTVLKKQNETFKKVWIIVKSWWLIAVPLLVAIFMGPTAINILFLVVSSLALIEFIKHSQQTKLKIPLTILFLIVNLSQFLFIQFKALDYFFITTPLLFLWIVPLTIISQNNVKNLPIHFSLAVGGLLTCYYLSYIPAIAQLLVGLTEQERLSAVILLILLTEINDVFQFVNGKLFGRIKPFPQISPNKTEFGFIGGIICTTLLSVFLLSTFIHISFLAAGIIGFVLSLSGMLGDLLFSSLKRYYGVKDFSDLIPGHGGIIDRVDSLIITAPIFFHTLRALKGI